MENPVVREVGDKDTEIFVHYGTSISVIVKTEYSEVDGNVVGI